ncbi:MAG: hypothetical protein MJ007_04855 [Paludibacteraceae bacterium]|nr:hypothetical protein [Paludibacteraceae bacterium]
MRLFVWENTGEVKPKEIETRLILQGHCGVMPYKKELTAFFGNYNGISKYIDEKPFYMVRCPLYSGNHTVGKDIVVIDNNSLRNPTIDLIHHYAMLLAHNEVTLVDLLVVARDKGIPVVKTEKQKHSVKNYLGKLFNGQFDVVSDVGMLGVDMLPGTHSSLSVVECYETRERLLKAFYSDIGVKSAFAKRSNTVEEEVDADNSLLLLNVSDMLKCREDGAKAVNEMFGTNWTVHVAKELKYGTENEPEEVATNESNSKTNI